VFAAMPQPQASKARVLAGVAIALVLAALPFANKHVWSREQEARALAGSFARAPPHSHAQVAAMRDASYAKDTARNARLQGPKVAQR